MNGSKFIIILHGEKNSSHCFEILRRLNLFRSQTCDYHRLEILDAYSLARTLLYALHYQAYFRYQAGQYREVRNIIRIILLHFLSSYFSSYSYVYFFKARDTFALAICFFLLLSYV